MYAGHSLSDYGFFTIFIPVSFQCTVLKSGTIRYNTLSLDVLEIKSVDIGGGKNWSGFLRICTSMFIPDLFLLRGMSESSVE
jgi:hypothetical protein